MKAFRKIHRWSSLFILFFLIFYCVSGIFLNHKKTFKFLKTKIIYEKSVEKGSSRPVINLIEKYKKFVPEKEKPRAIVIDDKGRVIFLFGAMKKLGFNKAYFINPKKGKLQKVEKLPVEPFYFMKNFHKSYRVKYIWTIISDILTVIILISCISGILIINFKKIDYYMVFGGMIFIVLSFMFCI